MNDATTYNVFLTLSNGVQREYENVFGWAIADNNVLELTGKSSEKYGFQPLHIFNKHAWREFSVEEYRD